ncbi:hypothetical protein VTN00DRAFT_8039 [Thermoascus crustaceus]|uniref:uncharacterized protein n=1 Tax=Thermoascus crustaceus TaxID=5088 RepID=UPI0037440537
MRTRSTTTTKDSPPETETETEQPLKKTLTPAERPSKAFILPSDASEDARFVVLPNPSTGSPNRYFFCPKLGLYEFTAVSSSPDFPRSILFAPKTNDDDNATTEENKPSSTKGAITKKAELLIATPVDSIFFLIPILCSSPSSSKVNSSAEKLFRPLDDIFDSQDELPKHLRYVLYHDSFRPVLESRMEAICDMVEAGDEKMFRLSKEKLIKELIAKAERVVAQGGLPATLEERFVRQALETPLLNVKREDVVTTNGDDKNNNNNETKSNGETRDVSESPEKSETQSSSAATTTPSGESTPATQPSTTTTGDSPSPDTGIAHLQRIRIALSFIQSSYLPPHISTSLDEMLDNQQNPSPIIDFKPLTEHLKHIADLRAEALASRSLGDFSRKRAADDDEEMGGAESRAERKRRKEEEEKKKKAGQSRGVRELKKVDTSGMKKMSDFFGKAAAKKKT